jgi:hypothetical protein
MVAMVAFSNLYEHVVRQDFAMPSTRLERSREIESGAPSAAKQASYGVSGNDPEFIRGLGKAKS